MSIVRKCFVRVHSGDSLLCNPQNGASMLLKDAEEFLCPLVSGIRLGDHAAILAKKYGLDLDAVLSDLGQFYRELAGCGLVDLEDDDRPDCVCTTERPSGQEIHEEMGSSPVSRFYLKHEIPSEIHIDLTNSCTERCIHCYVPKCDADFLEFHIVSKVLQEFRRIQGLTVTLSGGECMLHPRFCEICKLCRDLDLNFVILSNLSVCDKRCIETLKSTQPQAVNVSLYSMDSSEHDAITKTAGSWVRTMTAIDACQQAGIPIRISTPLLRINKGAFNELRKFAVLRRLHLVPTADIYPQTDGDCSNLEHTCRPEEIEKVFCENRDIWELACEKSVMPDDRVCNIGDRLFLNARGYYYPCSTLNSWTIGDARDVALAEVWQGEKMKYLRGLKNKDFPQCVSCSHRAFCKVCPAFNFNATGSLFKTIPAKCAVSAVKHKVYGGQ